jgi:hypothetical protein
MFLLALCASMQVKMCGQGQVKKRGEKHKFLKKHAKTHKTCGSLWGNIQAVTVQHIYQYIMLSFPPLHETV